MGDIPVGVEEFYAIRKPRRPSERTRGFLGTGVVAFCEGVEVGGHVD